MHTTRTRQRRWQDHKHLTRSLIAGACLGMLVATGAMAAAPMEFPTATTTVKVDGVPLTGQGSQDQDQQLQNTVVYDNGTYYLWYQNGSTDLKDLSLATSTDGVNFTYVGNFTPPEDDQGRPWYMQLDGLETYPKTEPRLGYPRLQKVGDNWIMAIWNLNQLNLPTAGDYTYNTALWNLGPNPDNYQTPIQIGPLPVRDTSDPTRPPGTQHAGTFGIVPFENGDFIYTRNDATHGLGRYQLQGGATQSLPVTLPAGDQPDIAPQLYDGTGWCHYKSATCLTNKAYVHNYGRTLLDGGKLHTYYGLYNAADGLRAQQQLWRVESTDASGTVWGQPQALFADGSAVTVDGLTNTGNFSNPEVVPLGGGEYRSYFSTRDACGNWVMVTNEVPGAPVTMTIAKDFEPNEVAVNGNSTLTVTVTAPDAPCSPLPDGVLEYTNISYIDKLPEGVEVVSTDANTCGNASNVTTTTTSFTVSGFKLAAGESCTTTLTVKPTRVGVFNNIIYKSPEDGYGGLSNEQGVPAAENATDTLRTPGAPGPVTVAPIPTLGQVSLGLLGLLMAGWGARSLRRRQG